MKASLVVIVMAPLLVVGAWTIRFELKPVNESARKAYAAAGIAPTVIHDRWTGISAIGGGITTTSHALSVVAMVVVLASGAFALWLAPAIRRRRVASIFLVVMCLLWVFRFRTIESRELLDRWSGVSSIRTADTPSPSFLPPPYAYSVATVQATPIPETLTTGASVALLVLAVLSFRPRASSTT